MEIIFLGGAGTVTGSKFLLRDGRRRILVDCGLFQGYKALRLKNWAPLPVAPAGIDSVVITHAHLDHSGYLPLLVRNGFRRQAHVTPGTADLLEILLTDSGFLMEQEADYANRHGFSRHRPARPLYTEADARAALKHLTPVPFHKPVRIRGGATLRFLRAGHILGASMAELEIGGKTILFTGDLGRPQSATMVDPEPVRRADVLVVESTYGDRTHNHGDAEGALADIINRTAARGGTVIIPAFAVGRTQSLLYHLHRLKADGRIPDLPVFLDSPMAVNASEIFCRHNKDHRLSAAEAHAAFGVAHYVHSVADSQALDTNRMPKVILSASGMLTGGRVVHHLKSYAPNPANAVVLTGFQAGGTRGAALQAGADAVKIHGQMIPVKAEVLSLDMLSAHADGGEILDWLKGFEEPPAETFIVHGEPDAADQLRLRIEDSLGWSVTVPDYRDRYPLFEA